MRVTNQTPFAAGWTVGFAGDGRELLIVAVKATYELVSAKGALRLAEQQQPLRLADEFAGDPATSSTTFETDYAHVKVACDVLLAGRAHAPHAKPVQQLLARVRVGALNKTIRVNGQRQWVKRTGTWRASTSERFTSAEISYECAFGGTDPDPENPAHAATFQDNPVGRGFRRYNFQLDGVLMPSLEEPGQAIDDPQGTFTPMSFGPVGRSWRQRVCYAGTYDQAWLDQRSPLWPLDFDPRYFQGAPSDQQLPFPIGGEPIELVGLVPPELSSDASVHTRLPDQQVAVAFFYAARAPVLCEAALDTILLEPDHNRFSCTWRVTQPMLRDVFDVEEIVVGDPKGALPGRVRAKTQGKLHVSGLSQLPLRSRP